MTKERLLVVDADALSAHVLEVALRRKGYRVTTATDGREALLQIERAGLGDKRHSTCPSRWLHAGEKAQGAAAVGDHPRHVSHEVD
jgi:CheY-like chemotaxis protein